MAKNASKETAAAKRKQSTAPQEEQNESRNAKLNWDYENTLSLQEMADAIGSDLSVINVGYNTNSDDEDFPVLKIKAGKKLAKKLPEASRGFVTFAPSLNLQKLIDKSGEEWNKAYVMANARHFGFIPHPEKGYEGIGKLCLMSGNYESCDLSDLLEDEDDE